MADPLIDGQPGGAQQIQRAIDAGADPNEVHAYYVGQAKRAIDAGANSQDLFKYYGWDPKQPDIKELADHVQAGISQLTPEDHTKIATTPLEQLAAGFQTSIASLTVGGRPTLTMPKDPGLLGKILSASGQMAGDLPATITGFIVGGVAGEAGGAAAGGAAGSVVGPEGAAGGAVAGGTLGGLLGAGAGSAALPQAMRSALMQVYDKNPGNLTWKDTFAALAHVSWSTVAKESAKAGAAGAAGNLVAGPLGSVVSSASRPLLGDAASAIAGRTANLFGFSTAAATVGAGLDGRVPDKDELITGAALAVGFGLAHAVVPKGATQRPVTTPAGDQVAKNLSDIYVDTGQRPLDVGKVAAQDLSVREEVLAPTAADGARVTPLLDQMKLAEPKPYTEAFHGSRHDLTEFDTDKIGTGEGAQAYGHGFYFAQNPKVASFYKDAGAEAPPSEPFMFRGQPFATVDKIAEQFGKKGSDEYDAARAGANLTALNSDDPNAARHALEGMIQEDTDLAKKIRAGEQDSVFMGSQDHLTAGMDPESEAYKAIMQPKRDREASYHENEVEHYKRTIDWLDKNGQDLKPPERQGNVYRVRLNAGIGHNMLDWDKPLEAQSVRVQNLFHDVKGVDDSPEMGETIGEWHDRVTQGKGETARKDLAKKLSDAGIRGFHYLDRDSRARGEGSHNMVIFNKEHIQVTHKNGQYIHEPETFEQRVTDTMLKLQGDNGESEPPLTGEIIEPTKGGGGGEPPVAAGMTRLYRGETDFPNEPKEEMADWLKQHPDVQKTIDATGRWFVKDRSTAEYYNQTHGDKSGRVSYVDVPTDKVEEYQSANQPDAKRFSAAGRENEEYFVPKETAAGRQPLPGTPPASELVEGGGEPPKKPPEERPAIPGPGEPGRIDILNDNEMRKSIISDIIAPKAETPNIFLRGFRSFREFVAGFQSQLTPARELDRELNLLGEHTEEGQIKAPGGLGIQDMFRMMYGSQARANFMIRHGGLMPGDGRFERTDRPSWYQAFKEVTANGGNTQDFYLYRLAARTVEKAGQGVDTGIPLDVAAAHVADPKNIAMYEEAARILSEAKDGAVDYYQASGMLSGVRAAAMKELNRYHIVFNRIMDPSYKMGFGRSGTRQVKTMEGSERQIEDPAKSEVDNLHSMIGMADRNRAIGSLIGHIELRGAQENYGLTKVDPREVGVDLDTNELLKGDLLDEDGKVIPQEAKEAALPYLARRAFNNRAGANPNDFLYFRDGVPEVWRSADQRITDLVRAQSSAHNPNILVSALRFGAKVAGYGISAAPDFIIRSLSHGQFAAGVAGEHPSFPLKDIFRGLPQALREMTGLELGSQFKDFQAQGGGTSLTDMDKIMQQVGLDYISEKTGLRQRVWNTVKSPLEAMRIIQHTFHTAAQYGNYKGNIAAGEVPLKAFNQSATNYLDFREGFANAHIQEYSRWVRFMSVGFKDIEQFARAMQERPAATMARGFMYLTVPTIGLAAANYLQDQSLPDAEKYANMPQYIRDGYFVSPAIPRGDGTYYRLKWPKPYVLNYMFSQLPERFVEFMANQDPRTFGENMKSLLQSFVPPAVPNLLQPAIEHATNTKLVSGTPLIPSSLENPTGYMQYGPNTTPESVALARLIGQPRPYLPHANISPVVLDNYINELGGTLPYQVIHAINGSFQPPSDMNQGVIHDLFTRSFYMTHHDYSPLAIDKAHEFIHDFTQAHANVMKAAKEGNLNNAFSRDQYMAATKVTGLEKALSGFHKIVMATEANDTLTLNEKQKAIDTLYTNTLPAIEQYTKLLQQLEAQANGNR